MGLGSVLRKVGVGFWHALYVVALLWGLKALDRRLLDAAGESSETSLLRQQLKRTLSKPKARVVVLGQSTTGQWLTPQYLAPVLGLRVADVADAHLSGCHQDCTWAEVKLLSKKQRHFDVAFWGVNLYQMCDIVSPKRALQQVELLPASALPELLGLYFEGEGPLRYVGTLLGAHISAVYADGFAVQRYWYKRLFGSEQRAVSWYADPSVTTAHESPSGDEAKGDDEAGWSPNCDMKQKRIQLKLAMTEAVLDELALLADQSYLLMLPDRTLTIGTDEQQRRWATYRELVGAMTDRKPHVALIDLASEGPRQSDHYRDGAHLNARGLAIQKRLFEAALDASGARPSERSP